jgi:hypothetical protein
VAAVLAFALVGLAFVAAPHIREKPPAPVTFLIPPPEKGALDESTTPAVSPDGRRIAFRANVDGERMVCPFPGSTKTEPRMAISVSNQWRLRS